MNSQLLNGVQVDHLPLTSNISAGVDMSGFRSVSFLVNFQSSSGNATMTLEQSVDNSNWTAVTPGYSVSAVNGYPTADVTPVVANVALPAANRYLAIEFNRPGREMTIQAWNATPTSNRYLRVNITAGTPLYALALKALPAWEPVSQPEVAAIVRVTN